MRNLMNKYLPTAVVIVMMLSALTFIGGVQAFIMTQDALFLDVTIAGMQALCGSVVFGITSLFVLD